ncbi:hypothetical protein HY639_02495 [Candidatus Woesearchaeota archaeon]|nr:hypothetical protein [Candidatus Woesearchaeota archaeon]
MRPPFEQAKNVLEGILHREWAGRGAAPEDYLRQLRNKYPEASEEEVREMMTFFGSTYFLGKEIPELTAKGTRQIVLSLGNGYIGKTRVYGETSTHYIHTTLFVYEPALIETIDILRELDFDVPEHHYVGIEQASERFTVRDCGLSFVITVDLTAGGKYLVEDVKDSHFETLTNGAELKQQLITASRTLQEIYDKKNSLYEMQVNDHITSEGPQEAFRHQFFTQMDPVTNRGKLVLGDVDHILFYRIPTEGTSK